MILVHVPSEGPKREDGLHDTDTELTPPAAPTAPAYEPTPEQVKLAEAAYWRHISSLSGCKPIEAADLEAAMRVALVAAWTGATR